MAMTALRILGQRVGCRGGGGAVLRDRDAAGCGGRQGILRRPAWLRDASAGDGSGVDAGKGSVAVLNLHVVNNTQGRRAIPHVRDTRRPAK